MISLNSMCNKKIAKQLKTFYFTVSSNKNHIFHILDILFICFINNRIYFFLLFSRII